MKTIAISIDESTLAGLDRVARERGKPNRPRRGFSRREPGNRSRIVREAVREYLQRRESLVREEKERKAYAKHRRLVSRQAKTLIGEQAKP